MAKLIWRDCDGNVLMRPDDGRIIGVDIGECCCPPKDCGVLPCQCVDSGGDTNWTDLRLGGPLCYGLDYKYEIENYNDGDLTPPGACNNCGGSFCVSVWPGIFWATAASCTWAPKGGLFTYSVSNKRLRISFAACGQTGNSPGSTRLQQDGAEWRMEIHCGSPGATAIWIGNKTTGQTPEGIFNRISGSDGTSALSIVRSTLPDDCTTTTTTT